MPDVLVTAFITDASDKQTDEGFDNAVELGYSDNGTDWGFATIEAASTSSPGLTVLGDQLWVANRDGTGSALYATSPSVGAAASVAQNSAVAPALTTLGQELVLAYVGSSTSRVEVVTSANGSSWSAKSLTGQASHIAPAAAVLGDTLWVAYVGEATGHVELVSQTGGAAWTAKIDTGQPSELPPALAVFDGQLWVAYVNGSTGAVELLFLKDQTPSAPAATGQTSHYGPGLTAFNGALWVAYIGEATGNLELVSSSTGSAWSAKTDTGCSSQCAPALTVIPAVAGPDPLAGSSQYVLTSTVGAQQPGALPPLQGVNVRITVTDDLTFDASVPPGFQFNCYSAAGNQVLGVQQYVLMMQPGSTELFLHIQNFGPASVVAVYAGNSDIILNFPELGVIPAGYTFDLTLNYTTEGGVSGTAVSGMSCTVTNAEGTTVGSGSLTSLGLPLAHEPGAVTTAWLAPVVAAELDIVAYAEAKDATFTAGHGYVVYRASQPLQANPSWTSYVDSPGDGTSENSNCVNGLIAAGTTFGTVQSFGVPSA